MYEWEQSFEDVTVLIRPPEGVTAKHLAVSIQSNKVSVGIKGEKPFIDCETFQTVDSSTSTWTLSACTVALRAPTQLTNLAAQVTESFL